MSDKSNEANPIRIQVKNGLSNLIQKYRTILISMVALLVVVLVGLAVWSQVESSTKKDFAARMEKSQEDLSAWMKETDTTKKDSLAKTLEDELVVVEKNAPLSYGLLKAWFLHGDLYAEQKNGSRPRRPTKLFMIRMHKAILPQSHW